MFHVQRRIARVLLAACLCLGVIAVGDRPGVVALGVAGSHAAPLTETIAAGVVLAKPNRGVDATRLARVVGASSTTVLPKLGVVMLHIAPGQERSSAERLRLGGLVEYATPDYLRHVTIVPNDPDYPSQWALPKIDAPQAWQTTDGSPNVVVAVIDTGYDLSHPDRPVHLIPGPTYTSSATTDGCGPEGTNGPQDDDPEGHGTHVGGIVAAAFNNDIGVAGLAPGASLLVVKAADCTGTLADSDVVQAIVYAADAGARVINMSFGGPDSDDALKQAVQYAAGRGVVLVAAAGNQSSSAPFYPAAYPNVTAVAATDQTDSLARFSNFGSYVALAAPGVGILSTVPGSYAELSGTSMAAPHVAAVAALVWSVAPNLTSVQVVQAIERGAVAMGAGCPNEFYGYGRVDAARALAAAHDSPSTAICQGSNLPPRLFLPLVANH